MFPLLGLIQVLPDRVIFGRRLRKLAIPMTAITQVETYLEPAWRRPQIVSVRITRDGGETISVPVGRVDAFGNYARAIVERIEEARLVRSQTMQK
jgi:hypothetical protein